jgi:hypothetical protein
VRAKPADDERRPHDLRGNSATLLVATLVHPRHTICWLLRMAGNTVPSNDASDRWMAILQVLLWITIAAALLWAAIPPMHG